MRVALPMGLSVGALVIAAACGGGPPPPPPQPVIDSTAIRDSIAQAEAARRQADDESRRAREEAQRIEGQRRADSLAAIRRETERVRTMLSARIHFDFNRSDIRDEDAAVLDQKIAILQANPNLRITITGHCDERGSDEYNMALGNRRALSAKAYMTSRGISEDRIATASRGEESPVSAEHTEEAWTQNRRDEFSITAGGEQLSAPGGM